MLNVVVMGECMIEFSPKENDEYKQSFAGDVYNTAVYLKRLQASAVDVAILTGVGNDAMSEHMLENFQANEISTSLVQRINHRQLGAYLIQISAEGERSFIYWRNSSAAKFTMSQLDDENKIKLIDKCGLFYFSGISIAILTKEDRSLFWQLIEELKNSGAVIVFDSNFRPSLWESKEDAILQFECALRVSDIVFAGVEDFTLLYNLSSFAAIDSFFVHYTIDELIIKNGAEGVFYRSATSQFNFNFNAVDDVVDSTAAGDSFNSGYLSAKINGASASEAIAHACRVSACVIQHKGAIIDRQTFADFIATETSTFSSISGESRE